MNDFEKQVSEAAQHSILKIISEGSWVQPDYANRFQIPKEFVQQLWSCIDLSRLQAALTARLEAELADRLVNHMAAEIATDVKQILSVKERREALRAVVRENIDRLTGGAALTAKEPQK